MYFLSILVLVSGSDPFTVSTRIGSPSDAGKHVARSHDQRSNYCDSSPSPAALKNGGNEAENESETEKTRGNCSIPCIINRCFIRDRDWSVIRQVFGERQGVESATNASGF